MGTISLPSPYENAEIIGVGGFGTVVRAKDTVLNRDVAIKLVPHRELDERTMDRFVEEAQRVAALQHPNIVTIHQAGVFKDSMYLVMEFATGGTLLELQPETGPMPIDQALKAIDEAAAGLQFAHDHGLVHQDVKPANLLVDSHGVVKVADFGMAREIDHSSATRGYTLHYAAPEQLGYDDRLSPATDVFALAATAWELLAGSPHGGIGRILNDDSGARATLSETIGVGGRALDSVFAAAMHLNPERRTQSTTAFAQALRQALGPNPVTNLRPPQRALPGALRLMDDRLTLFEEVSARPSQPSVLRDAASLSDRHRAALQASVGDEWFVGVKWSGAVKPTQSGSAVWVAVVKDGALFDLRSEFTREEAIDFIDQGSHGHSRVTAGFDFGFSVPAWYLDRHGLSSGTELWDQLDAIERAKGRFTPWPATLTEPFWGPNIRSRPGLPPDGKWFRQTEDDIRDLTGAVPKSVFQLTGAGSVGGMSVRGMPQLKALRARGWHVWPFDPPGARTVVEVFPRALLNALTTPDTKPTRDEVRADVLRMIPPDFLAGDQSTYDLLATNHTAFEAAFAAWSLWADGAQLPDLSRDPVAQREGRIWLGE